MSTAWWLNTAWMLKCGFEASSFQRATRRVAENQARILIDTLQANRDTEYGVRHGFRHINDVRSYQSRVPITTYEDYADAIRRIGEGQSNILTREPVRLLEPTSGTTGGEKLIPYTAGLRRQFQRGVAAWIADLFSKRPAIRSGRAYWSISPTLGPMRRSPGGIPIGFEDDAAYLGWMERLALRHLLVTPSALARVEDMASFRYCTLLSLLAAEDLTLISVWSPTFLTALLRSLDNWWDRLCHDLYRGSATPPKPLPKGLDGVLSQSLRPRPGRADRLMRCCRSSGSPADRLKQVWPKVTLISCWTDASAAMFVPELRELFPQVEIQSKGLLATEGFVSFPLVDQPGAAVAIRSHFFEFEESDGSRCRLVHELELGGRYRVVMTTAGGLYRYQMRDVIEVVGFHCHCPLIRFLGKSDLVSDLVGEKLAEPHVRDVLNRVFAWYGQIPTFALLVPESSTRPRYRLYLQGRNIPLDSKCLASLCEAVENGLAENPYYRHALRMGQLQSLQIACLPSEGETGWSLFEKVCVRKGQKYGNIKPVALDPRLHWPEVFAPFVVKPTSDHK